MVSALAGVTALPASRTPQRCRNGGLETGRPPTVGTRLPLTLKRQADNLGPEVSGPEGSVRRLVALGRPP